MASRVVLLAVISAGLAGCGGSGSSRQPDGKALFAQSCSACHSLSGARSPGRQGGDLLGFRFSRAVMLQFAREMPVRRRLNSSELRRVADYVVSVERGAR